MRSLRFVRLSILFVFVNTVSVSSLQAQKEETLYYDEDLKVTKNRSEAQYFRVITLDAEGKPIGKVKDYYITGELHAERWPIYIDREDDLEYGSPKSLWKGELVSYYKNGQKKSVLTLNDEGALTPPHWRQRRISTCCLPLPPGVTSANAHLRGVT